MDTGLPDHQHFVCSGKDKALDQSLITLKMAQYLTGLTKLEDLAFYARNPDCIVLPCSYTIDGLRLIIRLRNRIRLRFEESELSVFIHV